MWNFCQQGKFLEKTKYSCIWQKILILMLNSTISLFSNQIFCQGVGVENCQGLYFKATLLKVRLWIPSSSAYYPHELHFFPSKLVAQRQEKKDILVTTRPRNEDVTTMTVHKKLKEKEKWVVIVRNNLQLENYRVSQKNWVLPNWAFGDPATNWEEILLIFMKNLQMLNW